MEKKVMDIETVEASRGTDGRYNVIIETQVMKGNEQWPIFNPRWAETNITFKITEGI